MRPALEPFRLPGFRRLSLAYAVNELGNGLGEIALAVLVYEQTGSALATAGLFIGMQFVPAVLAQGVVARLEVTGTRIALPAIYAAEGLIFVALAVISDSFVLWAVIALATLDGALVLAGRAFVRAALHAVLSPTGILREGNALINVVFTLSVAGGPLIAAVVVAGLGIQEALLLDAASFLFVAAILAVGRSMPDVKAEEPEPWRQRLAEGLAYVNGRPILKRLLGTQAVAFIFFAAVLPVEIVYAIDTLDAGRSGYGILLGSWGAGMVVGSLVFALARRTSLAFMLLTSTLVIGAAYLAMGAAGSLAAACVAAALGGAGNGVLWVALVSATQAFTEARYQARVVALLESSASLVLAIGFPLGGILAFVFNPRVTFIVAGAGVLAVAAVAVPLLRGVAWPEAGADTDLGPAELEPDSAPGG